MVGKRPGQKLCLEHLMACPQVNRMLAPRVKPRKRLILSRSPSGSSKQG